MCGLGQGRANAAAPFGRASVVADFDADGRLDIAIADRLDELTGEHEYDLDIELSAGATERLPLAAQRGAVTIIVQDIDHDDDLDVVVVMASTREVVAAAWVNDGAGRFSPASPHDLELRGRSQPRFGDDSSASSAEDLEAPPRGLVAWPRAASAGVGPPAASGAVALVGSHSAGFFTGFIAGTRAPPVSL